MSSVSTRSSQRGTNRRLFLSYLRDAFGAWVVFVLGVGAITIAVGVFGTVTGSGWEQASQLFRWYALFVGVTLVSVYLPLQVQHGRTRSAFVRQAAVFTVTFTTVLALLTAAGFGLETLLYRLSGWPQDLTLTHLFTSADQLHLVFTEFWAQFLVWISAASLISAGFYRQDVPGLLVVPFGIAWLVVGEAFAGSHVPMLLDSVFDLRLAPTPAEVALVGVGAFLFCTVGNWLLLRGATIRSTAS